MGLQTAPVAGKLERAADKSNGGIMHRYIDHVLRATGGKTQGCAKRSSEVLTPLRADGAGGAREGRGATRSNNNER